MPQKPSIGIVGSGSIAEAHAEAWVTKAVHVHVFSVADDVQAFADRFGMGVADSLESLFARCDIIDVCTPTDSHKDIVLRAAQNEVTIICEKPLALCHQDAKEMLDACAEANVDLYPAHVVRYFDEYAAAKKAVDNGAVGEPAIIRLSRRGAKPTKPWFSDTQRSGGVVVDQMIHDFDYARWVAGEVSRVYAKLIEGPDGTSTAYAVLTHESGALSHVSGGWGPSHTVFSTSFSISGSNGQLNHSSSHRPSLLWDTETDDDPGGGLLPDVGDSPSPFTAELTDFLQAATSNATPTVTAADGLAALDIALAAAQSAETGQPVNIEKQSR